MSKSAASVAITQRINTGHISAKLIVNLDVTALIHLKPGLFQTEVVGVRHATDCEKHMRADDRLIAAAAINLHGHSRPAFFKADAFSAQTDLDTFAFENCFDVSETSSSSRRQSRGPFCTTVTSLPKRRYI